MSSVPVSSNIWLVARVATTSPAYCCGRKQSIRRRNQASAADVMCVWMKACSYAIRWLCISTLHVSFENRVPSAESAASWRLLRPSCGWRSPSCS
ncbi:hypothetical protein HA520_08775 [Azotobacter chroococcum]|uniref:Uncharacterized protein n=1 Tax=Azotobacter chroococcum TaxID=353 RepID=A0AA43Z5N2_9GAMM|nr:hypothetical protein [Azotobacter chroococcum]TBW11440.1 hypothetical protein E0E50_08365 [Azotobacter chroococcum subsp. isscasi]